MAHVPKTHASYSQLLYTLVIEGLKRLKDEQNKQFTGLSKGFDSAKEYIDNIVAELKTQIQELAKNQKVQQTSERDHRGKQKEDFADLRTQIALITENQKVLERDHREKQKEDFTDLSATLAGVQEALITALIENQKFHQTSERDHREKQKEDFADLRAQIATLTGVHKALITALIENQVHQTSDSRHKQSKPNRPVRPRPLDRFSPSQRSQRVSKTSSGPRMSRVVPRTTRLLRSTHKRKDLQMLS